jgi:hypothetical protein
MGEETARNSISFAAHFFAFSLAELIYRQKAHFFFMCATCGCGVDLGSTEEVFAKNHSCLDCGQLFKGFGYKLPCPRCKSTNTKIAR